MPSHRKPKLNAARNQARTLTLCAATIGAAAVPALASAASATSGGTSGHTSAHTAPQPVIAQAVASTRPASHHSKSVAVTASTASSSGTTDYTVQSGDTLFGIASRSLGSGYKYPELFKMNKGRSETGGEAFTNADLIRTGWTISIPSSSSSSSSSSSGSSSSGSTGSSAVSSSTGSSGSSSSSGSSGSTSSASTGSSSGTSSSTAASSSSSSSSSTTSSTATSSSGYANDLNGWINQAISILAAHGYSVSYNAVYETAMNESSGNPNAENGWDSNAAAGTPSIGLMQVIQPTFNAYAISGYDDIWNPVDNIIAAAVYAQATYGGLDNVVASRCGGSCWSGY